MRLKQLFKQTLILSVPFLSYWIISLILLFKEFGSEIIREEQGKLVIYSYYLEDSLGLIIPWLVLVVVASVLSQVIMNLLKQSIFKKTKSNYITISTYFLAIVLLIIIFVAGSIVTNIFWPTNFIIL